MAVFDASLWFKTVPDFLGEWREIKASYRKFGRADRAQVNLSLPAPRR